MKNSPALQLYFKEFIKTEPSPDARQVGPAYRQAGPAYREADFRGVHKLKKTPDYVWDLLIYEPRTVEEAKLGSLFILGKIDNIPKNKHKNIDFLLNLLISAIKREFYSDPNRSTLEAMEASLNKANLYLVDFAERGNKEWIGNLHFVCGAFNQNTLHITSTGESIIKLFRNATVSHVENKFSASKKNNPLKVFNNIASGTMLNGDKVVLGTKDVLKIASVNSLKELFKKGVHQTIDYLKKAEEIPDITPLICLIIEARAQAPEEIAACLPQIQETKIKDKSKIQKTIQITLIGSYRFVCLINLIFKKLLKLFAPLLKKTSKISPLHKIRTVIEKTGQRAKELLLNAIEKSEARQNYDNLKNKFIGVRQKNKPAFFVLSLILILILVLSFLTIRQINYRVKLTHFNELKGEIQEIQKQTDAALIYSEKEKAKGLIQKNQPLVAYFLEFFKKSPLKHDEQLNSTVLALQEKYQEQQDSINNVKRIKNLEEILDFSKSGFIVSPMGINKIANNLYFYELESGILYKVDLSAGSKDLILIFISDKDELRKMVSFETGKIALFGQSGKAYVYNADTNDHNEYALNPGLPIEQIKDLESFSSNFYVLNSDQGNIIKYSLDQIKDNAIQGASWLSAPNDELKQTTDIATDGSIYALGKDGLILGYFKGKKTATITPLLETPLAGENKLFIANDFKNFYVSDPKNKRLIVLNKQGEMINQYANDEFSNIIDFLITGTEQEVYLLCDKKVFRFGL